MTTVYNVQLSGSAADLYADSVAVFSWLDFDWDGGGLHTRHGHSLEISRVF